MLCGRPLVCRRTKCNHNGNQQAHYNKASHAEIGYPPSRRGGERVMLAAWYDPLGGGRKEGPFSTWRVETPHSAQLELALRAQASSPYTLRQKNLTYFGALPRSQASGKEEKPASLKENCLKLREGRARTRPRPILGGAHGNGNNAERIGRRILPLLLNARRRKIFPFSPLNYMLFLHGGMGDVVAGRGG